MTTKAPQEYLTEPYGRLLVREPEGGFSAELLEFPGCIAEGETADEAVENVERAAEAWIASEIERDHRIPEPLCGSEYSGRFVVRLPRSLHRALALMAQRDNTSINQEIVAAVASWLGSEDAVRRLIERASVQQQFAVVVWQGLSGTAGVSMVKRIVEPLSTADTFMGAR